MNVVGNFSLIRLLALYDVKFPAIAQLVERLTVEVKRSYQAVGGSTPPCRTIFIHF